MWRKKKERMEKKVTAAASGSSEWPSTPSVCRTQGLVALQTNYHQRWQTLPPSVKHGIVYSDITPIFCLPADKDKGPASACQSRINSSSWKWKIQLRLGATLIMELRYPIKNTFIKPRTDCLSHNCLSAGLTENASSHFPDPRSA